MVKKELDENDLIELGKKLREFIDMLEPVARDWEPIMNLLRYIEGRLKELAWRKYRKERGLE